MQIEQVFRRRSASEETAVKKPPLRVQHQKVLHFGSKVHGPDPSTKPEEDTPQSTRDKNSKFKIKPLGNGHPFEYG